MSTYHIDAMSFGGRGIARKDGKIFFISGAIVGDEVEIEITKNKKRFAEATVTKLVKSSKESVEAPCPIASQCGGCQWQRAPYQSQLDWKKNFIRDALKKTAKIPDKELPEIQMIPSQEIYQYRNRTNFKMRIENTGEITLGFYREKSHTLLPLIRCEISDPEINKILPWVSDLRFQSRKHPLNFECEFQKVEKGLLAGISFHPKTSNKDRREIYRRLSEHPSIVSVNEKKDITGDFHLFDDSEVKYFTRSGQFQQVNLSSNRKLRSIIADKVEKLNIETIVDLYCGGGNLSLHLAKKGHKVWGIEVNEESIKSAQYTQKYNNIDAEYRAGKTEYFLKSSDLSNIDLVITDPPRRGMAESIDELCRLKPQYVFYVSCDPNTLARDIEIFAKKSYTLEYVYGFDFFPQTYHVETFAILKYKES